MPDIHDPSFWDKEPAIITGLVAAVLIAATAFGIQITDGQQVAVLGLVAAALSFIGSLVIRSQVSPTAMLPPKQ